MTELAVQYINPWGTTVETRDAATATPQAGQAYATVELRNGVVSFVIELTLDPNTYPFMITGGTIVSGICGAPWNVTTGYLGATMLIEATRHGQGNCANKITVVGEQISPPAWRGTYGFDGQSSTFRHTTLFRTWHT
ncbi:MAG TPA: hypothetical protein VFP72_21525 [Kineosporiaceae bacterium]|nr:hypothetical protein [Kineosporiaceae bacterium]